MTERGRAVFHQLVQNYENRMKDGSLYEETVDLRLKMKLPIKLNTIDFLDKINLEKEIHNAGKADEDIPAWIIAPLPKTVAYARDGADGEHLFNSCAVFKANANNEDVVDYIVIRAANQDVIKYGEIYNADYFDTFRDAEIRDDWENTKVRLSKLFPTVDEFAPPSNEWSQYPNLPQALPKPFEFYWGQVDLTPFREEYRTADAAAHKAGIEDLSLSDFEKRYGRYPSKREDIGDERYLYQDKSSLTSEEIFHGLLSGEGFYTDNDLDSRINTNFEYSANNGGMDLKQLSSYYCSYTHANPNNEEDLLATKAQITRVLRAVTELTPQEISLMFERLQDFDRAPNLLENFIDKVIEYGKQNGDAEQALNLARKIAVRENREDLTENSARKPAKFSVAREHG